MCNNQVINILVIISLPIVFLYPHSILNGQYLNYTYVCAVGVFALLSRCWQLNRSSKLLLSLFFLNLFANIISLALDYINDVEFLKGNAVLLSVAMISLSIMRSNIRKLLKALFVVSVAVNALICIDGLFKPNWLFLVFKPMEIDGSLIQSIHYRAVGSLLSPVSAGFFSASSLVYCIAKSHYSRLLFVDVIFLSIASLAMFFTLSRTAFLALTLTVVFYFIYVKFSWRLLLVLFTVIITFSMLGEEYFSMQIENIEIRNEQFRDGVFEGTGRMATILSTIDYKIDARCLLFGIGMSEYSIVENTTFSLAHNGFLSIIAPWGLFGVIIFYKIFKILMSSWNKRILCHSNGINIFNLFTLLWSVLSLGTFLSADMPVAMYWLFMLSYILPLSVIINSNYGACFRV